MIISVLHPFLMSNASLNLKYCFPYLLASIGADFLELTVRSWNMNRNIEKCIKCAKSVYPAERLAVGEGQVFHKVTVVFGDCGLSFANPSSFWKWRVAFDVLTAITLSNWEILRLSMDSIIVSLISLNFFVWREIMMKALVERNKSFNLKHDVAWQ